jgi:hypothetical protein
MSAILQRMLPFIARRGVWSKSSRRPMPIIVGSPRSGTTLLRFMLDSHPELAIPPETGFLTLADTWLRATGDVASRVFEDITTYPADAPAWHDFHIPADAFRREVEKLERRDAATAVRLFYRMYASRFGKRRWGDKTPMYCRHILSIERLLPEARFIHIIRDGRDAALSLRSRFFSPGYDIETQAKYWRDNVQSARQASKQCEHYLELRYEDLLQEPEATLKRVCSFVSLDFSGNMLLYHIHTPDRLREHLTRSLVTGHVLISHEERLRQQAGTMRPPDLDRIEVWRRDMDLGEVLIFQRVAGDLLKDLGYPLAEA